MWAPGERPVAAGAVGSPARRALQGDHLHHAQGALETVPRDPQLTARLPALAASVIQGWITARYGLRVGVIAILHTFNGLLEFNSHVHTMVSAGGLMGLQWADAVKRAGIDKKIGWHTFRHTFSTLVKSQGVDAKVVQELLRHASFKTTMDE
jgi:integrase